MTNKKTAHAILVLGANGKLGKTVYSFLKMHYPTSTWGTTRRPSSPFLKLTVKNTHNDLKMIQKKIGKINYIINCIGAFKSDESTLIQVNSLFPITLSQLAELYSFNVIHVSTDAVFSALSKNVYEDSFVDPSDFYGISKLLGESSSPKTLTIRTSFLGFDPFNKTGLIEWVLKNKSGTINGYLNQKWSGCTTLQFSELCFNIIKNNSFSQLRKKSRIFHFAPIGPTNKYNLINEIIHVTKKKVKLRKSISTQITRTLATRYGKILNMKTYSNNIEEALLELAVFEKKRNE